jgi:hypothetical protein
LSIEDKPWIKYAAEEIRRREFEGDTASSVITYLDLAFGNILGLARC